MSALRDAMSHAALGWVKPELDETLRQVRNEVEYFVEDPADDSRMRFCAGYLHQVQGTLRMVELYAPAMVAEELELLANAVREGRVPDRDEACATLMRGTVLLPDYLERLQNGHRDIPIVLLPLLNEIRAARGEEGISESVLLAFDPEAANASEAELDHARGSLSGRNRELLDTVGSAVKEELLRIKDALDLHMRTGSDPGQLQTQVDELSAVADTLGVLGLGMARGVVVQQRDALLEVVSGEQAVDETLLLDIAGALLYVDASLDDQVAHLGASVDSGSDASSLETRRTVEVLAHEAIANFAAARESFVAFIETNWDHQRLLEVPRLLDEVAGALRMLDLKAAADYLAGVRQYIEIELLGRQRVPSGRQLDTLADAMASLEYYLEALRDRRAGREDILDITRSSLEALRYWPLPAALPDAATGSHDGVDQAEPAYAQALSSMAAGTVATDDDHDVSVDPALASADAPALPASNEDGHEAVAAAALIADTAVEAEAAGFVEASAVPAAMEWDTVADVIPALPGGDGITPRPYTLVFEKAIVAATPATAEVPVSAPQLSSPSVPEEVASLLAGDGGSFDPVFAEEGRVEAVDYQLAPLDLSGDGTVADAPELLAVTQIDSDAAAADHSRWTLSPAAVPPATDTDYSFDRSLLELDEVTPFVADPALQLDEDAAVQSGPVAAGIAADVSGFDVTAFDAWQPQVAAPSPALEDLDASPPPVDADAPAIGPAADEEAAAAAAFMAELDAAVAAFDAPTEPSALPAPAAVAAAPPVAAEAEPAPVMLAGGFEDNGDEIDQDIREVFIEEFDEELVNLGNLLPIWRASPGNMDRLRPLRRVFHTLKGSGRLVGARTLGEFSWKIEGMLNRVLDGSRPASPAVVSLVGQAYAVLPELNAALRGQGQIHSDLLAMQAIADRVGAGEEVFYVATPAPASQPTEGIGDALPVQGTPAQVDSVLLEILQAEIASHLETVRAWLATARPQPQPASEELLRAVHTMSGAFAMTDVPEITAVTVPAESFVKRSLAAAVTPSEAGVEALADTAAAIATTITALQAPSPRIPSFAELAARLQLLLEALPEAKWPPLVEDDSTAIDGPASLPATSESDSGISLADAAAPLPPSDQALPTGIAVAATATDIADDALAAASDVGFDKRMAGDPADDAADDAALTSAAVALSPQAIADNDGINDGIDAVQPVSADATDAPARVADHPAAVDAEAVEPLTAVGADVSSPAGEAIADTGHEDPPAAQTLDSTAEAETEVEAEVVVEAEAEATAGDEADAPLATGAVDAVVDDFDSRSSTASAALLDEDTPAFVRSDVLAEADALVDPGEEWPALAATGATTPPLSTAGADGDEAAHDDALLSPRADERHDEAPPAALLPPAAADVMLQTDEAATAADTSTDIAMLEAQSFTATLPGAEAEAEAEAVQPRADDSALADVEPVGFAASPADGTFAAAGAAASGEVVGAGDEAANALAFDEGALDFRELDQDLVDIFVEEGEDLLDHCDGLISELRNAPDDREALAGLQRDLHTLKGGARMAGINAIGDLGHAIESLLEAVAANRTELSRGDVQLLERGFDRLHQLLTRTGQHRAVAMPHDLIAAFGARTDGRGEPAFAAFEPSANFAVAATPATAPAAAEPVPAAAAAGVTAVAANAPLSAPVQEEPVGDEDSVVRPQEQVRVRSDLLDRLVNHAGEVAIYRSRLEQQLGAFRGAMAELDRTNARLRDQLRRLDLETEAQIVARYRREQEQADQTFDPLELDRFSTLQQLSRALNESAADLGGLQGVLDDLSRNYDSLLQQQSRVSSELQDGLMRARMVPFDGLVPRLRRVVRQAAQDTGKQVHLSLEGTHGELDRNVLDRMVAPLEHMLRNSVAHGLELPEQRAAAGKPEEGGIVLRLRREGSEIVLEVADDGAGLDREAIRRRAEQRGLIAAGSVLAERELDELIFASGFSTSEQVSQLAGRGVGMDVVRNEVRQLGGSIDIDSVPGQGVTFTLRLPQTLAVTQAVFVQIGDTTFAVPVASVSGIGRIARERFESEEGRYHYNGEEFALHDLGSLVGQAPARAEGQAQVPLLLVRAGDLRVAVAIDQVLGNREIVVKPVGLQIASVPGIYGATITGDGNVVVILDVAPLVRRHLAQPQAPVAAPAPVGQRHVPMVMVVDDSLTMRKVTGRVLERHNFEVVVARDGIEALERLEERVPDLMLLDIEMPRMDGYELATAMRADARFRNVPIVMITSRSGDKHRQRAFEIGVQRYLGKPYQELDLMRNVYDLLGIARVRQ